MIHGINEQRPEVRLTVFKLFILALIIILMGPKQKVIGMIMFNYVYRGWWEGYSNDTESSIRPYKTT